MSSSDNETFPKCNSAHKTVCPREGSNCLSEVEGNVWKIEMMFKSLCNVMVMLNKIVKKMKWNELAIERTFEHLVALVI